MFALLKDLIMTFVEYAKTLPIAEEIYESIYGEPKTHAEWAEKFNKVGDINKILIKTWNG